MEIIAAINKIKGLYLYSVVNVSYSKPGNPNTHFMLGHYHAKFECGMKDPSYKDVEKYLMDYAQNLILDGLRVEVNLEYKDNFITINDDGIKYEYQSSKTVQTPEELVEFMKIVGSSNN